MKSTIKSVILGTICAALATGCGGGHSSVPAAPTAGSAAQQTAIETARISRLPATIDPAQAVVSGKITLTGLTLVDSAGHPLPGNSASTLSVRIIDPGDDILSVSAGNTDTLGAFSLTLPTVTRRQLLLEISGKVLEDVTGDATGNDTLLERVPVTVVAGHKSNLTIALKLQAGLQPGTAGTPGVTPPPVIVATVDALDANGHRQNSVATDYKDKLVVADLDGDGVFDSLRDGMQPDADQDGLPDALLPLYEKTDAYASVYGLITGVDQSTRTVQVLVTDGTNVHTVAIKVDPFAATELYLPSAPGSNAFAVLGLGQFLTGHYVWANGYFSDAPADTQLNGLYLTVL